MPIVKKTKATPAAPALTMPTWLWKAPAKFAALSLGFLAAFAVLIGIVGLILHAAKGPDAMQTIGISPWLIIAPFIILLIAAFVYAIYKCVKWSPARPLDRAGFVAADTGFTILHIILFALPLAIGFNGYSEIMLFINYMKLGPAFIAAYIAMALVCLYIFGTMIASTVATYRRGQGMNVPRWKLIASIPFGLTVIYFPGFFLPEEKKQASQIPLKAKWFKSFTGWIVSRPLNAIIVFAVSSVALMFLYDLYGTLIVAGLALILFFIPWAILGGRKLRAHVPGIYANLAVVINTAFIISIAYAFIYAFSAAPDVNLQTITAEQIEITDTVKTVK
ncbi:MAG: hypothetical protein LBK26_04590 [Rickettsiales bacterium]|jgi:hypothetical protein|nr:hypothetical protein [Rickettsiales bacterium]